MNLSSIQQKLREFGIDAWLFCDHHQRDSIAYAVLDLDTAKFTTRRWFYCIPASGEPTKIVHRIEAQRLTTLPGSTIQYARWQDLHAALEQTLRPNKTVAMQFSPDNNIPQVSLVDGGTIDLVRGFGINIVSSANLVQLFLASLDPESIQLHEEAGKRVQRVKDDAFARVFDSLKSGAYQTEYEIQQFILARFAEEGLDGGEYQPMVAANDHAADPHFEVEAVGSRTIRPGDALMIDLWAKLARPGGIFYDITWCAFLGDSPPEEYVKMFKVAVEARKRAKNLVVERFQSRTPVFGYEVDQAARACITDAGYGDYFTHRTGHSIGTDVHGIGVNIDNLETKDDRQIIPGVCFSIEPGIYKPPFGVRTEINLVIDYDSHVLSFGPEQEELLLP